MTHTLSVFRCGNQRPGDAAALHSLQVFGHETRLSSTCGRYPVILAPASTRQCYLNEYSQPEYRKRASAGAAQVCHEPEKNPSCGNLFCSACAPLTPPAA